jgi:hypothetical protein
MKVKPSPGSSGIALGSFGTLVYALLARQWDIALAVAATIIPGALAYVIANGGLRGLWHKFLGDDEHRPPAVRSTNPRRRSRRKRRGVTTEPSRGTA